MIKRKGRIINPQYTICPICKKGYLMKNCISCYGCGLRICPKCSYNDHYLCDECANYSTESD